MNRIQKTAWYIVICISTAVVMSLIAVGVLYYMVGMPRALLGFCLLSFAGFLGFAPLIFRKDKGKVTCDERDTLINRRAALAGFGASYLVTGLACMLPFTILGPKAVISVGWLPNIFAAAGLTSFFVWSVAILVQYGWKENKNE
jgi:hypothetical protein